MPSIPRLFAFAREHQNQARHRGDDLRAEQWNDIIDQLIGSLVRESETEITEYAAQTRTPRLV